MVRRSLRNAAGLLALGALLVAGAPLRAGAAAAGEGNIPTVASFQEAKARAAERHIPILVDFSAEW